ncbi:hypothetical protein CJF42_00740 [Pseudoalteromonas sp. NBT06-2]|uniref:hypothetical protein n=1 Tax=Pseudoalteromonas sp. NBT06-2 TaxID=2025950 RepID=UPI000BA6E57D|nr:hypothetical protein [Pseudoalteromonas sp. NBT06-2]PAJ76251.1 hypothetical protein CJF42_00740 [Pseudoalteromonas sp. NBT06-2]
MKFEKIKLLAAVLAVLSPLGAQAEFASKDMDLLDKPSRKAKSLSSIAASAEVVINKKKGLWLEVSVDGATGWVRKLHIRKTLPSVRSTEGSLSSAASMGTGRNGSANVVSSTGVRGLDADALSTAEFNKKEFEKFLILAVSSKKAKKFAKKAKLKKVKI